MGDSYKNTGSEMGFSKDLMDSAADIMEQIYNHPFITGMIDGTLDKEAYLCYLIQDTKYLVDYAKVYATAFVKCQDVPTMRHIYQDMGLINSNEGMMHIRYLKDLGWTEDMCYAAPMLPENRSYLDYMLKTASEGTVVEGLMGVMSCAFSYYQIACYMLKKATEQGTVEGNYYRGWFEDYSGPGYKAIYDSAVTLCDALTANATEAEKARYIEIYRKSSEFELGFWQMPLTHTKH